MYIYKMQDDDFQVIRVLSLYIISLMRYLYPLLHSFEKVVLFFLILKCSAGEMQAQNICMKTYPGNILIFHLSAGSEASDLPFFTGVTHEIKTAKLVFDRVSQKLNHSNAFEEKTHDVGRIIWLIFLIMASFVIIIGFSIYLGRRNRLIREQLQDERQYMELQLLSLRNQLTPHFVFNALNAIGSSIYQDDKEKSYDFLQRFSILIRSTLSHADKSNQTLREELEFVRNYLELERFRFENKFEYSIHIQEGLNQETAVPKMVIQTFAENALKHGLVRKSGEGKLKVDVSQENQVLKINIEDNGIRTGETIKKSVEPDDTGIEIMKQFIALFNRFNSKKIDLQINDVLNKMNIIAGTSVTIHLPVDFTYNSIPVNI